MSTLALPLNCRPRLVPVAAAEIAVFERGARAELPETDLIALLAMATRMPTDSGPDTRWRLGTIPDLMTEPESGFRAWSLDAPQDTGRHLRADLVAIALAVPLALAPAAAVCQVAQEGEVPQAVTEADISPASALPPVQAEGPTIAVPGPLRLELPAKRAASADEPPQRPPSGAPLIGAGLGMTVGGGVLLGIGAALAGHTNCGSYGSVGFVCFQPYTSYSPPFIIGGGALLGVGIPFLIAGIVKEAERSKPDRKRKDSSLSISISPRQGGWAGRVSIRF